jgi:hypothetical protein
MTMTKLPKATNTDFVQTPAGVYRMKLKDMEEREQPSYDDPTVTETRVQWTFEIEDVVSGDDKCEDFIGQEFWAWTSKTMGRKAKMREWAEALVGRPIDDDEELDPSQDLLGRRVVATVVAYIKMNGQPGTKLGSVAPYRARRQTEAVTAEAISGKPEKDDLPF